jgi:heme exporter protein A
LRWRGRPIRAEREEYSRNLVFIGHLNALKDDLTALENLQVAAALAGMSAEAGRMLAALDRFGVAHCAELPAKVLSQGQRRRVALSRLALSAAVPLWILDEPFSALDAGAVVELERLLGAHLASGGMVVLTTHQEVQVVAHAVLRVDLDVHTAALLAA